MKRAYIDLASQCPWRGPWCAFAAPALGGTAARHANAWASAAAGAVSDSAAKIPLHSELFCSSKLRGVCDNPPTKAGALASGAPVA
jgi:hypothetical protein